MEWPKGQFLFCLRKLEFKCGDLPCPPIASLRRQLLPELCNGESTIQSLPCEKRLCLQSAAHTIVRVRRLFVICTATTEGGGLVSALKKHIPSLDTTALLRLRRHIMKHCTKSIRVNSITSKKEHFLHTFVETLHHYLLSNKIIPLVRDTLAFRTLPKKSFSAKLFALVLIVLLVSAYSFMKTPFGVCNWH